MDLVSFDFRPINVASKAYSSGGASDYNLGRNVTVPYTASKDGYFMITVHDDEQGGDGCSLLVMDYNGDTVAISETYSRYRHRDTI